MKRDPTFNDDCLSGSMAWAAMRLGRSVDWFRSNRDLLEQEGFPKKDPIIGLYMKSDVNAWLDSRAQKRQSGAAHHTATSDPGGYNSDAL